MAGVRTVNWGLESLRHEFGAKHRSFMMTYLPAPDIDPRTGWSRAAILLMERAVCAARKSNQLSWTLYPIDGAPVLHVGKRSVCVLGQERVELFVDVYDVEKLDLRHLDVRITPRPVRDFPRSGMMDFPVSSAAEVIGLVEETHLKTVRAFARIKADPNRGRLYVESLRLKLNEVGGVNIPRPYNSR
jgi:hypothetical protein